MHHGAVEALDEPGYDVIGDVHGHAARLVSLLELMGYEERAGAWCHSERSAVFVGDLIDRGPRQLETLQIVRAMVDAGSARVVMGNHEFNAIAYATVDPVRFEYCRPHNEKNDRQHEAFLAEVPFDTPLHRSVTEWFTTFPLWLDLGGVRVVHACWSERHMEQVQPLLGPGRTLTDEVVAAGVREGTDTYESIEVLLKGPEVSLNGCWYQDKDGNTRHDARFRWWDPKAVDLQSGVLIPPGTGLYGPDGSPVEELPNGELPEGLPPPYDEGPPVLFGHYWARKQTAAGFAGELARCIDYSVAKNGVLAAYRWSEGESSLAATNIFTC